MSAVENVNKQDLKLNSYDVSAVLPCTTRVAYPDSPKDLTLEKTGSFLGKSLRSPTENFFTLFEC